jgi:hypothetical protein
MRKSMEIPQFIANKDSMNEYSSACSELAARARKTRWSEEGDHGRWCRWWWRDGVEAAQRLRARGEKMRRRRSTSEQSTAACAADEAAFTTLLTINLFTEFLFSHGLVRYVIGWLCGSKTVIYLSYMYPLSNLGFA